MSPKIDIIDLQRTDEEIQQPSPSQTKSPSDFETEFIHSKYYKRMELKRLSPDTIYFYLGLSNRTVEIQERVNEWCRLNNKELLEVNNETKIVDKNTWNSSEIRVVK